jgi:hypothetical protein
MQNHQRLGRHIQHRLAAKACIGQAIVVEIPASGALQAAQKGISGVPPTHPDAISKLDPWGMAAAESDIHIPYIQASVSNDAGPFNPSILCWQLAHISKLHLSFACGRH